MGIDSYASAGVDIDRGDRFVEYIKSLNSGAVSRSIGGFAGGMEIDLSRFRRPILLSTTDGVGTKLLVAQRLQKFDTVGIDLVAMCVNDLIVCGARPLSFLDYIAAGRLNEDVLERLMRGIVAGCEQADCTLAGGETAEMPDLYQGDDFDLAGFAVGLVEKDEMLPRLDRMAAGDRIFGLPSTGIHSNGLSLARKVVPAAEGESFWQELLTPTKIYVRELALLLDTGKVLAAAHITGGGLEGNFARIIPPGLTARFSYDWPVPSIFDLIRARGAIPESEMRRVFNMGVGIAFVAKLDDREAVLEAGRQNKIDILEIGELVRG